MRVVGVALVLAVVATAAAAPAAVVAGATPAAGAGAGARKPRPAADLQLALSDSPDPVRVGQELTYRISVRNRGPRAATRVVVAADLPVAAYAHDAGRRASCTMPAQVGRVACRIPRLAAGSGWALELRTAPASAATLRADASVHSAVRDPRRANNRASTTTQVTSPESVPPAPGSPPAPGGSVVRGPLEVPLYLASYCVGERSSGPCLEEIRPTLESLPAVRVQPGDVLTFHLGFAPKGVRLLIVRPGGEVAHEATLSPAQTTSWRVPDGFSAPQPGVFVSLDAFSNIITASYYARLVT